MELRGEKRIRLDFVFHPIVKQKIKALPGARWHPEEKCWHIPYEAEAYKALQKLGYDLEVESPSEGDADVLRVEEIPGEPFLKAFVPWDRKDWQQKIKTIPGFWWEKEGKYWRLPYVQDTLGRLRSLFGSSLELGFEVKEDIEAFWEKTGFVGRNLRATKVRRSEPTNNVGGVGRSKRTTRKELSEEQEKALVDLEEKLILRRYSYNTRKSYKSHLRHFFFRFPKLSPKEIEERHIEQHILEQIREKDISESTQNQIINALKYYLENVLGRSRLFIQIDRPKKSYKLPNVLSESEVGRLIRVVDNAKHRCILMMIYSAGLRLSEVVNLQLDDLHTDKNILFVRGGKGKKDRETILSARVKEHLDHYMEIYKPSLWLFEGQFGGRYSVSSVQKIFNRAKKKSGINSRATVHTLRHSFATHLVEKNVSLSAIQQLLGHNSIKTTEVYLHISDKVLRNIRSPIDDLDLDGPDKQEGI
jgi:site-specific recombinase XerD